ncbi:hypothetical protein ACNKHR_05330 [Shigella flexneri]
MMGFVVYVGVYSLLHKTPLSLRHIDWFSSWRCAAVIGYCAVTGEFDSGAAILLAIFSLWQMPPLLCHRHFPL